MINGNWRSVGTPAPSGGVNSRAVALNLRFNACWSCWEDVPLIETSVGDGVLDVDGMTVVVVVAVAVVALTGEIGEVTRFDVEVEVVAVGSGEGEAATVVLGKRIQRGKRNLSDAKKLRQCRVRAILLSFLISSIPLSLSDSLLLSVSSGGPCWIRFDSLTRHGSNRIEGRGGDEPDEWTQLEERIKRARWLESIPCFSSCVRGAFPFVHRWNRVFPQ